MNIALTGRGELIEEILQVVSQGNNITQFELTEISKIEKSTYDVVIDLSFDQNPEERWLLLSKLKSGIYLLGSCLVQLGLIPFKHKTESVFGICNLPSLISRNTLEYTSPLAKDLDADIITKLGFETGLRVDDRVGMVSPRVICMIINEAYYTLQEGTASKKDIDLGMKLGTAYPFGPFEWSLKMGVSNVYKLLKAVFEDTTDERYKVCNLLKTEANRAIK